MWKVLILIETYRDLLMTGLPTEWNKVFTTQMPLDEDSKLKLWSAANLIAENTE